MFLSREHERRCCTRIFVEGVRVRDVSALHWLARWVLELRERLVVEPLLVQSIRVPFPRRQVMVRDRPPLAHQPQVPATTDLQQLGTEIRRDRLDVLSSTLAPSNRRELCFPVWIRVSNATVHQPCCAQKWSLHIEHCKAHSKLCSFTSEVHSSLTVAFQRLSCRGLER